MIKTSEVLNKSFGFIQKYFVQIFLYYLLSTVLNVIVMLPVLVAIITLQLFPLALISLNKSLQYHTFPSFKNIVMGLLVLVIGVLISTILQLKISRIPYTKTLMNLYDRYQNKDTDMDNEESRRNIFFQSIRETKWTTAFKVVILNAVVLLLCVLPFLTFILTPLVYNYLWLIIVIAVIAILIILAIIKPLLILSFAYFPLVDEQDTVRSAVNISKILLYNALGVYGLIITLLLLFSLGLSLLNTLLVLLLGWIPSCVYVVFYKELRGQRG